MRWHSRFAIGALLLVPTVGASAAVAAAAAPAPRALTPVERSVSAPHSSESAVIANEPASVHSSATLRSAFGTLPAPATTPLTVWALIAIIGALMLPLPRLHAVRLRAPPMRFL
jgi:hypothetical protein